MPKSRAVEYYECADGRVPFRDWQVSLDDSKVQTRVDARIARLSLGLQGDCEPVGDGVHELRIHFGAGYRLYFANDGPSVVLLLCGGSKRSQQADIDDAKAYWKDHKERKKAEKRHVKKGTPVRGRSS